VDPVPDTLLLRKSGSSGNGTTRPQRRSKFAYNLTIIILSMSLLIGLFRIEGCINICKIDLLQYRG
jgi:hypothetical protein